MKSERYIEKCKIGNITVNIYFPDDMTEIRKVWTNTYCKFAAELLNKSDLPIETKYQVVDELIEYFSASK